jgi:hypothetical protein
MGAATTWSNGQHKRLTTSIIHSRFLLLASACPCPPPVVTMPSWLAWSTWAGAASWALAGAVFAFLDVVDVLLCFVYGFLDGVLEDSPVSCYCHRSLDEEEGVSDTLYVRRSVCRDAVTALVGRRVVRRVGEQGGGAPENKARWSDCGCASCGEWRRKGSGGRLHFVLKEPTAPSSSTGPLRPEAEDAIFIHGFTSSSSFWAETVFREEELLSSNCRLLAVDLLGFGRSPKPAGCKYTLRDHVDAIERSVVEPMNLTSFHLVGHSMGCIVALALAARHPSRVKSITLVAPVSNTYCTTSMFCFFFLFFFFTLSHVAVLPCAWPGGAQ